MGKRRRLELSLELLDEDLMCARALPALEEACEDGKPRKLLAVAREVLPALEERAKGEEERVRKVLGAASAAAHPDVLSGKLASARLEALLADGKVPSTEAAREAVAWALLRGARLSSPVSLGEDWDVLRSLIDPERKASEGLASMPSTLEGKAFLGEGALATESGFALARGRSYATGWNRSATVREIARVLERVTLDGGELSPRKLERARAAFTKLTGAYREAASLGAGIFLEVEIV